jgi:hypothetical protein
MTRSTPTAGKKGIGGVQKLATAARKRRFNQTLDTAMLKLVEKEFGRILPRRSEFGKSLRHDCVRV